MSNSEPVANYDALVLDDTFTGSIELFPLANDTDPDGDALTISRISATYHNGTVTLDASGRVFYNTTADDYTPKYFHYYVSDGNGGFSFARFDITRTYAVNEAPVINLPSSIQVTEHSYILAGFWVTDRESSDHDISISITGGADMGAIDLQKVKNYDEIRDGAVQFHLQPPITGIDSLLDFENPTDANGDNIYEIELTATDSDGATTTKNVQIEVTDRTEIVVTTGDDKINGTANSDAALLLSGDDTFYGGDGHDGVGGAEGNDLLFGDGGRDDLHGQAGNDRVFGGDGNDTLSGGGGDDTIHGNDGDDQIWAELSNGGIGNDKMYGGNGNDTIIGGAGNDVAFGDAGNDHISGGDGFDRLWGGDGNDRLSVNRFQSFSTDSSTLSGGAGDDTLLGASSSDVLRGDDGNDFIRSFRGNDLITGGNGNDTLYGGSDTARLLGGADDDYLNGNGLLNGGSGDDIVDGSGRLIGGTGHDKVFGNSGDDTLFGGSGDDRLEGEGGIDRLDGGTGNDTMIGGADADTFIITHHGASSDGDIDTITDLNLWQDELIIRAFNGNSQTRVDDVGELFALNLAGLTITDTGADTMLTFDEGDGTSHQVLLIGIDDPLTVG